MRKFIDDAADDHGSSVDAGDDDDKPPVVWSVALTDDCDACEGEIRVVLTVEPVGEAGRGMVAHLAPSTARRLRKAVAAALKEVGEPPE